MSSSDWRETKDTMWDINVGYYIYTTNGFELVSKHDKSFAPKEIIAMNMSGCLIRDTDGKLRGSGNFAMGTYVSANSDKGTIRIRVDKTYQFAVYNYSNSNLAINHKGIKTMWGIPENIPEGATFEFGTWEKNISYSVDNVTDEYGFSRSENTICDFFYIYYENTLIVQTVASSLLKGGYFWPNYNQWMVYEAPDGSNFVKVQVLAIPNDDQYTSGDSYCIILALCDNGKLYMSPMDGRSVISETDSTSASAYMSVCSGSNIKSLFPQYMTYNVENEGKFVEIARKDESVGDAFLNENIIGFSVEQDHVIEKTFKEYSDNIYNKFLTLTKLSTLCLYTIYADGSVGTLTVKYDKTVTYSKSYTDIDDGYTKPKIYVYNTTTFTKTEGNRAVKLFSSQPWLSDKGVLNAKSMFMDASGKLYTAADMTQAVDTSAWADQRAFCESLTDITPFDREVRVETTPVTLSVDTIAVGFARRTGCWRR